MLLHLSDLHFGTERSECIAAIQRFCAQHRPEVVVVSGDLTQRAKLKEFYACKQFLESLNTPYFVVPGNHDIPLYRLWHRFIQPFVLYQLFFGSLEQTLLTEHYYLIGINSIRRRYHTRGSISPEQIDRVDQQLIQAPSNKLKIIVSHQPFYIPDNQGHYSRHINDCPRLSDQALQRWGRHQLFALLHGHLHLVAVYDLNAEFHLNVGHPIYEVHAGTSISSRLHDGIPNNFNVILASGEVQHYFFDEKKSDFFLQEK